MDKPLKVSINVFRFPMRIRHTKRSPYSPEMPMLAPIHLSTSVSDRPWYKFPVAVATTNVERYKGTPRPVSSHDGRLRKAKILVSRCKISPWRNPEVNMRYGCCAFFVAVKTRFRVTGSCTILEPRNVSLTIEIAWLGQYSGNNTDVFLTQVTTWAMNMHMVNKTRELLAGYMKSADTSCRMRLRTLDERRMSSPSQFQRSRTLRALLLGASVLFTVFLPTFVNEWTQQVVVRTKTPKIVRHCMQSRVKDSKMKNRQSPRNTVTTRKVFGGLLFVTL